MAASLIEMFAKEVYRLVRYPQQRRKFAREFRIRKQQDVQLRDHHQADTTKLIVFLVPGADWYTGNETISGGVISIFSLAEEVRKLEAVHSATVIVCTTPGEYLLLRYEKFPNDSTVYRFSQLPHFFSNLKSVTFHVPEYMVDQFQSSLTGDQKKWIGTIPEVHINVMNQNIALMPPPESVNKLASLAKRVTITTAHTKYCNEFYRQHFGVPLHKLSVWISPEDYDRKPFKEKQNIIMVSPDPHPQRERVLAELAAMPGIAIRVVQNMSYQAYKHHMAEAKWSLTFGEGLDGYFIEGVFSGAVGFAVYNEEFFTDDFKSIPGICSSYDGLLDCIRKLVTADEAAFNETQQQQFAICARYYSRQVYRDNIISFLNAEYTYE